MHRWRRAPWWVVAFVYGVVYGAVGSVLRVLMDGVTWSRALESSAVTAVFMGLVLGGIATRQRNRALAALGGLDADGQDRAVRAATRGPVPRDPSVRAAAVRLVEHKLELLDGQRPWVVPLFTVLAAVGVLAALAWSPWYWLLTGSSTVLVVGSPWQARRLQRRLAVLEGRHLTGR